MTDCVSSKFSSEVIRIKSEVFLFSPISAKVRQQWDSETSPYALSEHFSNLTEKNKLIEHYK